MKKYKKIIILGGSGSGKSTLANRISIYFNCPVYHLDNLFLNPDWNPKDKDKWEEVSKEFLLKDTAVVEGNYTSALQVRINWADLIIYINTPTYIKLYRIFKRYFKIKLGLYKRLGRPEESKNVITWSFFIWVLNWDKTHRKVMLDLLKSVKDKKVLIISNPRELNIKDF